MSSDDDIFGWPTKKKQVIQAVTFLSPNVGGHQQPFKGHVYPSQNEYDRYVYTIFPYMYRKNQAFI